MKALNVGCGSRTAPGWVNLDLHARAPGVLEHNILHGLPFADGSFDVVYHSHVLEHLPRAQAPRFLVECVRVLRPGGWLRVVVPDLEGAARAYLAALDEARAGVPGASHRHEWMVLELIDQTVRDHSGGDMAEYLSSGAVPAVDFVLQRSGEEARRIMENARRSRDSPVLRPAAWRRLLNAAVDARPPWSAPSATTTRRRELLQALRAVRFRRSGELHQWMYDELSLHHALTAAGLTDVQRRTAVTSAVAGWDAVYLDAGPDGTVHKPDSLFMEGMKRS